MPMVDSCTGPARAVAKPSTSILARVIRPAVLDGLLCALLVVVAFLLGCYEMGDTDIWWHLRGGQWTLEHGRVPGLDPFTFGSADKVWVDIHWSYEVVLALAYRAGGVGALVLMGAIFGCGAFVAGLLVRRREWPLAVAAACWLPALVLFGFRLDPRPEIFSLFYLGCYLAVLGQVEDRPRMAWLLVPLQVLWVNSQGLFVLGPVLLGMFLAARVTRVLWRAFSGTPFDRNCERRWWFHAGGAAVAVVAACLINPYFLDGARFPFDLYPKVAEEGNIYKRYVDELMSPRDYVKEATVVRAGGNWFFLSCYFLLLLLPVSFLYPSLWRGWKDTAQPVKPRKEQPAGASPGGWLAGLAVVIVLLAANTLTLSGRGAASWLLPLGENVPLVLLLVSMIGAYLLRRSGMVALQVVLGGLALALWMAWLQAELFAGERGPLVPGVSARQLAGPVFVTCAVAGGFVLWRGGNLFLGLLAGAFGYLALQALQNWSRFALVAGVVLTWNFSEWACQLRSTIPAISRRWVWGPRLGLATALVVWLAALAADRYYVHTGEPRHLRLREQPLEFAHDAARFAGQEGMPERALVYGLGQTGVYVFHNAPRYKPFMDGRLEMPDRRTFETYISIEQWLRNHDPRWEATLESMGNPLVLLEHANNFSSEALLSTHPRWRCVYFDALASVFVRRDAVDEASFPSVDFAGRHFSRPAGASIPDEPGAARRELKALVNLSVALHRVPQSAWRWRIPVVLYALDRGVRALEEEPDQPETWVLLGNCYWELMPDLTEKPLTPAQPWSLERGLFWAQATWCQRRASECQADHVGAWRSLVQIYRVRGMDDAQLAAAERWLPIDPKATPQQREQIDRLRKDLPEVRLGEVSATRIPSVVMQLLRSRRPLAAVEVLEQCEQPQPGWDWPFAEQVAGLYMHLGRPADARHVWRQATHCPSEALRLSRLASTFLVERDVESAVEHFHQARKANPKLAEVYWGLAMLHAQRGDRAAAEQACRAGLSASLDQRQRADLTALRELLTVSGTR
jgi:tetratricopeptide (TPR) repeat protein